MFPLRVSYPLRNREHLDPCLGFWGFIFTAVIFFSKPISDKCQVDLDLGEKLLFIFFFLGVILCMGFSSMFHIVCCHSKPVCNLFRKLDYFGIVFLPVGSSIPWIYFSFYNQFLP